MNVTIRIIGIIIVVSMPPLYNAFINPPLVSFWRPSNSGGGGADGGTRGGSGGGSGTGGSVWLTGLGWATRRAMVEVESPDLEERLYKGLSWKCRAAATSA